MRGTVFGVVAGVSGAGPNMRDTGFSVGTTTSGVGSDGGFSVGVLSSGKSSHKSPGVRPTSVSMLSGVDSAVGVANCKAFLRSDAS